MESRRIFEIRCYATKKTRVVALAQVSDVRGAQDYNGSHDRRGAQRVMRAEEPSDCCPCGEILCFNNRSEVTIPIDDHSVMGSGGSDAAMAEPQLVGVRGPEGPRPPNASCTLFVDGLPQDCSRREVAHIFRPFLGYKGVSFVPRASRNSNGDPLVYCFVDFESPGYAASALDCLQGYEFDEQDQGDVRLRLGYAYFLECPGATSVEEYRGRS